MRPNPLGLALVCLLAACATTQASKAPRPHVTEFSDEDVARAMREQAHGVPIKLRCELFYRESAELREGDTGDEARYQHTSRAMELGPEETGAVTLGSVTLAAAYSDSQYEGAAFSLQVRCGERRLFASLYQFARQDPPRVEFVGDEGFTGLVYVTSPEDQGDYQYVCKIVRL